MSSINANIPKKTVQLTSSERAEIRKNKIKRAIFIILMIIVPVANFFIFYLYVNLSSIMMAFEDKVTGAFTFNNLISIGQRLFGGGVGNQTADMLAYLGNTMIYFLNSIFIMMPLITFIAYFIYKKIFMYKFFRVMFFLPSIISSVIFVTYYQQLVGENGSIYNLLNDMLGEGAFPVNAWRDRTWGRWVILVFTIWTGFGTNLILMTGAMNRIPEEVLEAAQLDGVGVLRELVSIILPLIWPTLTTLLVLAFTGIFTASGPLLVFDPNDTGATKTISFYIFKLAESGGKNQMREASATGLFFTIVGMPIIMGMKKLLERWQDAIEY